MCLMSHVHENDRDVRNLHAHFVGMSSVLWAMSATGQDVAMRVRLTPLDTYIQANASDSPDFGSVKRRQDPVNHLHLVRGRARIQD